MRRFTFPDQPDRYLPPTNGAPRPQERGTYVSELWNFVRRNRAVVLLVPLVVLITAIVAVRAIRPVYEAGATIRIDEDKSNVPIIDALKTLSSGSGIGTEILVLRSRTLAEEVIDSLRLTVSLRTPRGHSRDELVHVLHASRLAPRARYEARRRDDGKFEIRRRGSRDAAAVIGVGERFDGDGVSFALRQQAVEHDRIDLRVDLFDDVLLAAQRRIGVGRPSRDADIVAVTYRNTDRQLVAAVPNVLASRFITLRDRDRRRESESTVRFLEGQIGELSSHLTVAENELRRFRESSGVISVEFEARASLEGLGEMKVNRDMLAAEAIALEEVLRELESGPVGVGLVRERRVLAFPTLLRLPATSQLLMSLTELDDQRTRLAAEFPGDPRVAALGERIREVEGQMSSIVTSYLAGLRQQVASLDRTLAAFRGDLQQLPGAELTFLRLRREASVLEELYLLLQTRLKETEVLTAIEDGSVRVIDAAVIPRRPIRPNVPLTIGLALLVGSVLGVGAAFLREQVDTSVHTREDLQRATPGIPLLGTIPRIRAPAAAGNGKRSGTTFASHDDRSRMVAAFDPQDPVAEAYRSLRTSISFSRSGEPPRTLVFTSPLPGDGKSTSAANLAVTLARQGVRCIIVDADMRRGLLHRLFGAAKEPGLSNVLLGRTPLASAIQRIQLDDVEIAFLPSGVTPPNPAELIGSDRLPQLFEELTAQYDAVVVDAPPLNLVTDAALLGIHADGIVLVARAGVTDRGAISYAVDQLRSVPARVLGSVLNDAGSGRERYYGSYLPDGREYAQG
jgi:tyrosine-protein kinase Etk/Wzc